MYSLSFEKLNRLWGTLSDKQVPGVLCKARVVEEQADSRLNAGPKIRHVEGRLDKLELQPS